MGRVIDYVVQAKKTLYERDSRQFKLISGKDCCPDIAFQEFMATKKQYGKAVGMFFYQYVQSFSPDENITPEKAHEVGIELANYFKDHEVLISTHLDADHLHNHFIINSVSHTTGLKLQEGPDSLFKMRKLSDEICLQHGLSVLQPYTQDKNKAKGMNIREYRSALKGDSWKFKLINTIDQAMKNSHSKEEFIDNMATYGYQTNWTANRKHITYVTPDGKKCRDNKLHEEKYLKEQMEGYFFENGFTAVKRNKQVGGIEPSRRNTSQTLYSDDIRYATGAMGSDNNAFDGNGEIQLGDTDEYSQFADMERNTKRFESDFDADERRTLPSSDGQREEHKALHGRNEKINEMGTGSDNEGITIGNADHIPKTATNITSKGFVADELTAEMDRNRSSHNDSVMDAADVLESLINSNKSKKNDKEFENNDRRKQQEFEEFQQNHRHNYEQDFDSALEEEYGQEWELEQ